MVENAAQVPKFTVAAYIQRRQKVIAAVQNRQPGVPAYVQFGQFVAAALKELHPGQVLNAFERFYALSPHVDLHGGFRFFFAESSVSVRVVSLYLFPESGVRKMNSVDLNFRFHLKRTALRLVFRNLRFVLCG